MLKSLIQKTKDHFDKAKRYQVFKTAVLQAVSDGKLTSQEVMELDHLAIQLDLTPADVLTLKATALNALINVVKQDEQLSDDEASSLDRLLKYFKIDEYEIPKKTQQELARMRLLYEISQGILPRADWLEREVPIFPMQPEEIIHWVEISEAFELRSRKGEQYLDLQGKGQLLLTSQRIVFSSYHKTYSFFLTKIVSYKVNFDYILIYAGAKSKPITFKFDFKNKKFIDGILTVAHRSALNSVSKTIVKTARVVKTPAKKTKSEINNISKV